MTTRTNIKIARPEMLAGNRDAHACLEMAHRNGAADNFGVLAACAEAVALFGRLRSSEARRWERAWNDLAAAV